MTKVSMIRLPDKAAREIEKIADRKGLPFATVIKEIVCEHLSGNAPAKEEKF